MPVEHQIPREDTSEPALSSFWAKNRGLSEATALANLLKSLRKIAGHLGDNSGRVVFPGMSFPDASAIVIDPSPARGVAYPLDFHIIDQLAGEVVHAALRRIEWSSLVWKLLDKDISALGGRENVVFQKLVFTGEEIFTDLAADRSPAGWYAARARKIMLADREYPIRRISFPTLDRLLLIWIRIAWSDRPDSSDPDSSTYRPLLSLLEEITGGLRRIAAGNAGRTRRCESRADIYRRLWADSGAAFLKIPVVEKTLYYYPQFGVVHPPRRTGGRPDHQDEPKPLPPELTRQMETRLSTDEVDMTPIIQSVAGYDNPEVVRMSRWDFNQPCRPVIDRRLVAGLKSIFSTYSPRRKITSRGLSSGKIDPRRLYRAAVTGKCFRETYRVPEDRWQISLLVDASGSMRGNKMHVVENTVANLKQALAGSRNRLTAYAYFEVNKICMFSSLLKNGRLFSVPPAGKTASGQAIIAAAWLMDRGGGRKRNLLIHITDGESNFGCDVAYGIDYCRQEKIRLITLGCGCQDPKTMSQQYGRTIQFLKSYEQLPRALERLFKRFFIYANTRP